MILGWGQSSLAWWHLRLKSLKVLAMNFLKSNLTSNMDHGSNMDQTKKISAVAKAAGLKTGEIVCVE